jgi:hypothetical protein
MKFVVHTVCKKIFIVCNPKKILSTKMETSLYDNIVIK